MVSSDLAFGASENSSIYSAAFWTCSFSSTLSFWKPLCFHLSVPCLSNFSAACCCSFAQAIGAITKRWSFGLRRSLDHCPHGKRSSSLLCRSFCLDGWIFNCRLCFTSVTEPTQWTDWTCLCWQIRGSVDGSAVLGLFRGLSQMASSVWTVHVELFSWLSLPPWSCWFL